MEAPFIASTMARRGLLSPGSPLRVTRQLNTLRRWGFGLAGELRQAAVRDPGRVAVIDDECGAVTYAQLLDRSTRVSAALEARPGDRIGVLRRNSAGMLATLIGVTQLGADAVLVNTGLAPAQLTALTRDQGLRLVVHDDDFDGVPPEVALPVSRLEERAAGVTPVPLSPPERPSRTIVLTSGTTGAPKGARRPTPTGFGSLCVFVDRIPLRRGDRVMITAPLFHTWGYATLQIALALRATVVLRRRFDPSDTLHQLVRHECTALVAVPVMLQRIMELPPPERRPPLSVVAVSGSALPGGLATRFMDRFGDVLYNLYGSTEVSAASIATPADLRAAPDTAGRPPRGTVVTVRDDEGRLLPPGQPGRLFVSNGMMFEGYTDGTGAGAGELPTGDLGHLDAAGRVYVDGRADDMIVSGGENVFPAQVENLLADLPEVREVAVIGVPDDEFGQRLAAYVVLHDGAGLDADAIREHVRTHRARFCIPRDVVFLPALPRTATGKIVKRHLGR
jgi:acyl-CoA synthetase (AMP-forming)/AMP-acid ligase II